MSILKKLSVATAGAVIIGFGTVNNAQAIAITFNTSDNQFDLGVDNQGWWSNPIPNIDDNANYFVGVTNDRNIDRNFLTFDLSSLSGTVTTASLELQRYWGRGDATETLGLFDVSTDAATLNDNTGTNATIFADLGSGTSYGTFEVSTTGNSNETLSFALTPAAIADINSPTRGSFFSIGGLLLSASPNQSLFGNSGSSGIQRLVVDATPTAVPFSSLQG